MKKATKKLVKKGKPIKIKLKKRQYKRSPNGRFV